MRPAWSAFRPARILLRQEVATALVRYRRWVAHPSVQRFVVGPIPVVRLLAPLVVFGYLILLTQGGVTAGDWVCGAVCSLIALAGGRYPMAAALAQSGLLLVVEFLGHVGPDASKDLAPTTGQFVSDSTLLPVQLMASLALIELAVRRPIRQALIGAAVLTAAELLAYSSRGSMTDPLTTGYRITFTVVAPLLLGAYLRSLLLSYDQARRDVALAESRRSEAEHAARLGERTDVAREIHDVVAHHVASIALRSGVARRVLADIDPQVRDVLDDVHEAATTALTELRKLVTVLRDPGTVDPVAATRFGPGLVDPAELPDTLSALFDRARTTGLDVTANVDPGVANLDAVQALAVLRTVQEGLTNITKHVGRGAEVTVDVRDVDGFIEITVADDASTVRTSTGTMSSPGNDTPAPGYGLIGLSERLEMLGGTVDFGRHAQGWRVIGRFPRREPADRRRQHVDRTASG
jgi:signal transduction histidine kinase